MWLLMFIEFGGHESQQRAPYSNSHPCGKDQVFAWFPLFIPRKGASDQHHMTQRYAPNICLQLFLWELLHGLNKHLGKRTNPYFGSFRTACNVGENEANPNLCQTGPQNKLSGSIFLVKAGSQGLATLWKSKRKFGGCLFS